MYTLLIAAKSRFYTETYESLNDLINNLPSVEDRYEAFIYGPDGLLNNFTDFVQAIEAEATRELEAA